MDVPRWPPPLAWPLGESSNEPPHHIPAATHLPCSYLSSGIPLQVTLGTESHQGPREKPGHPDLRQVTHAPSRGPSAQRTVLCALSRGDCPGHTTCHTRPQGPPLAPLHCLGPEGPGPVPHLSSSFLYCPLKLQPCEPVPSPTAHSGHLPHSAFFGLEQIFSPNSYTSHSMLVCMSQRGLTPGHSQAEGHWRAAQLGSCDKVETLQDAQCHKPCPLGTRSIIATYRDSQSRGWRGQVSSPADQVGQPLLDHRATVAQLPWKGGGVFSRPSQMPGRGPQAQEPKLLRARGGARGPQSEQARTPMPSWTPAGPVRQASLKRKHLQKSHTWALWP